MTTSLQTAAADVTLQLHGYPAVTVAGGTMPLKLKRGLALLAYLHVRGGTAGRDTLAALLWPDGDRTVARARLRRLVHELQEVLGTPLLQGNSDMLSLRSGIASDWQATRQAMDTLARRPGIDTDRLAALLPPGAGRLLDGFSLEGSAFDDWLAEERRAHAAALAQVLQLAAERAVAQRDAALAEACAAALLRLDRCHEGGHAARIAARSLAGDAAGVETAYFECADTLRAEFGVAPSAAVESAYAQAVAALAQARPRIAYAPTSHGDVAYATWGRGRETLVVLWGLVTHLDVALEEPRARALLDRLATRYRVVMLDRRGCGLSERMGVAPSAETAAEDIAAVLSHLGVERAWLFGSSVGGTLAIDFALRQPGRVAGLLLFGTSPCGSRDDDWPWALRPEAFDAWVARLTDPAQYAESLRRFAPSAADDPAVGAWYARLLRQSSTRLGAVAVLRAYQRMDLRSRLHRLALPVLVLQRRGDRIVPFAAGQQLARAIPGAEFAPLEGDDHFLWYGDSGELVRRIDRFVACPCAAPRASPACTAPSAGEACAEAAEAA